MSCTQRTKIVCEIVMQCRQFRTCHARHGFAHSSTTGLYSTANPDVHAPARRHRSPAADPRPRTPAAPPSAQPTFLSLKLTFLSSKLTFRSLKLTFLSSKLTFLSPGPGVASLHPPVRYAVDPWIATLSQGCIDSFEGVCVNRKRQLTRSSCC
jgi:hypothetical protein